MRQDRLNHVGVTDNVDSQDLLPVFGRFFNFAKTNAAALLTRSVYFQRTRLWPARLFQSLWGQKHQLADILPGPLRHEAWRCLLCIFFVDINNHYPGPSSTNRRAVALPIPAPDPVIIAFLFFNLIFTYVLIPSVQAL